MTTVLTNHQTRIVIADDHCIFRKGLITALHEHSSCLIIGQASNGKELVNQVEQLHPDVVITDIQMPEMDGFEATAIITRRFPQTNVLALSMCTNESSISKMLKAGAKAYLLKTADQQEIINAIQAVNNNNNCYFTSNRSALLKLTQSIDEEKQPQFTEKELSVIDLICQQYSNKEIAVKTGCSTRSVESARERIQTKTGAKNMVGIALYAIKHALFFFE